MESTLLVRPLVAYASFDKPAVPSACLPSPVSRPWQQAEDRGSADTRVCLV